MDCRKTLELARNLIIQNYSKSTREIILDKERPVLKIVFNFEVVLYIRIMISESILIMLYSLQIQMIK